jgi:hypothetical protein
MPATVAGSEPNPLDYHRELFEGYRPVRALHERHIKAREEKLGLRLEAEAAESPTWKQLQRHEALYGLIPAGLVAAMGVEADKTPQLPAAVARRLRRRGQALAA